MAKKDMSNKRNHACPLETKKTDLKVETRATIVPSFLQFLFKTNPKPKLKIESALCQNNHKPGGLLVTFYSQGLHHLSQTCSNISPRPLGESIVSETGCFYTLIYPQRHHFTRGEQPLLQLKHFQLQDHLWIDQSWPRPARWAYHMVPTPLL